MTRYAQQELAYWRRLLGARYAGLAEHGVHLPWNNPPRRTYIHNYSSIHDYSDIVTAEIERAVRLGAVREVLECPFVVSPLMVILKTREDGTVKVRVVFDFSVTINHDLPHLSVKYPRPCFSSSPLTLCSRGGTCTSANVHTVWRARCLSI